MRIQVNTHGAPDFDPQGVHAGREYVHGVIGFLASIMITKNQETVFVELGGHPNQIFVPECERLFQVHVEETLVNLKHSVHNLEPDAMNELVQVLRSTLQAIRHAAPEGHQCTDACYMA